MKNNTIKLILTALPLSFYICALAQCLFQNSDYYLFKWFNEPNEKHLKYCFLKTGFQKVEFSGLIQHRAVVLPMHSKQNLILV